VNRPARRHGWLALGLALALTSGLAACSSGEDEAVPTPTPTITATPKPKPPPPPNPLTGRAGEKRKPVLVVKFDNTGSAHPHVGLWAADVGYIEQVEAGLTRIAAVFSSRMPKYVGPVRSARTTDIDLFGQYGRVAFTYSGAQPRVVSQLQSANLSLAPDGSGGGWFRGFGRHAPYNLFATTKNLLAANKTVKARDIGFRWGAAPKMRKSRGVDAYYRLAHVAWRWTPKKKTYVLSMDGSVATTVDHPPIHADNVIVQYVRTYASGLHDVNGNSSPFSATVGHGKAQFFRDGTTVVGTWKRKAKSGPTRWFVHGDRYRMTPGPTWIVLAPIGNRVTVL
jgi:hypothetical protein